MSHLQVDQAMLETTLDRMVRKSVEETLNAMLDAEADEITGAVGELLPGARYQRCMVHFERNILAKVNPGNKDWSADALKAVFSMESRDKALEKAESSPRTWNRRS